MCFSATTEERSPFSQPEIFRVVAKKIKKMQQPFFTYLIMVILYEKSIDNSKSIPADGRGGCAAQR